jgi:hypothetical protein
MSTKPKPPPERPTAKMLIEAFGISRMYAWELMTCHKGKIPSLALAQRIEERFGYPASAWKKPAPEEEAA